MKYTNYLLFLGLILTFAVSSCDNTLDLVGEGEDTPIIYALFSSLDNEYIVRVERGFIDSERPAKEIAQLEDSLYYKNAVVTLVNKESNKRFDLERVDSKTLGVERDQGFFLSDPNYVYYLKSNNGDFNPGDNVRLELKREGNEEIVFSEIQLLDTLIIGTPKTGGKISIPTKADYKIQWVTDKKNPASFYAVNFYIHYEEANLNDVEPEFVPKVLQWKLGEVREETVISTPGIDFFKNMGSNIPKGSNFVRTFEYIDAEFIYTGSEFLKYIDFISANNGITSSQPIPPYSNLSAGLGLVAERNVQRVNNIFLNEVSLDSIKFGQYTKLLNFK